MKNAGVVSESRCIFSQLLTYIYKKMKADTFLCLLSYKNQSVFYFFKSSINLLVKSLNLLKSIESI